ncbi:hypothetical protein MMMB2_0269 [Mycobacterium marinum MB2]|nr:hypothetical protein MMMB2_0269 [Mycobacterium marinum MB2]
MAAAALAALSVEPMPVKSVAAEPIKSGTAMTNDIVIPQNRIEFGLRPIDVDAPGDIYRIANWLLGFLFP